MALAGEIGFPGTGAILDGPEVGLVLENVASFRNGMRESMAKLFLSTDVDAIELSKQIAVTVPIETLFQTGDVKSAFGETDNGRDDSRELRGRIDADDGMFPTETAPEIDYPIMGTIIDKQDELVSFFL